jgi:hypothetical protein
MVAALGCCFALQSAAAAFETARIPLEHPANGDLLLIGGSPYLAVSGHSGSERWLSLVDLGNRQARRIDVPVDAQFIATGVLAGRGERLLFLGVGGVSAYLHESQTFIPLAETASLYRAVDQKRLRHFQFVADVNGNGLSDLLIPDFDAYHLFVQQQDGSFERHRLPVSAYPSTMERVPSYLPRRPQIVDLTLDGHTDIVLIEDGRFLVFEQRPDGRFSETPVIRAPGVYLTSDLEADIRPGEGRDFRGLSVHRVHALEDLNGDGVADLVVRRQQYQDGIDQRDSYRIHYGRRGVSGVTFPAEPDTVIRTEGMQLEPLFEDVNGNGRKDFGTLTATLGIGTIIRALLTGSATMDILFYGMDPDGRFAAEPDYRQTARVEISVRSRQADMPLLQLADLTGAGARSLLVGDGTETLWIYAPDGAALFARRGERVRVNLPRDSSNVLVTDITGNGKDDLVLPFGSRDGASLQNQLHLLLTP